jgi:o-succinylbenzoate synthase
MPLVLTVTPHTFHFRKPAATARGALTERRVWLLALADGQDTERVGKGECGPIPGLSSDDTPAFGMALVRAVERFNALELEEEDLQAWLDGTDLLDGLPTLRFGIETAVLDWVQGGRGLLWPSPFACDGAPLPTHGLIWMDTPEGLAAQIQAKVDAGFSVIKMKVGTLPANAERDLLVAVAERYPGISLRLDANGAFDEAGARAYLDALEGLPIEFLEQPVPVHARDALRRICAASPVPIVLDEQLIGIETPMERRALLDAIRPHGILLKPGLHGGFAACDDWIDACAEAGVTWWANSLLEAAIGHNAICQWTAARGGTRIHGVGTGGLFADNLYSPIRLVGSALVSEHRCQHKD